MAAKTTVTRLQPVSGVEGKVVIVTGASSGGGRELCLPLAQSGCQIVAAARRTDRLKSLCDEINGNGSSEVSDVQSVAVELDISAKGPVIEGSVQMAWDAFGRIDALVNNAGIRGGVFSSLDWPEEEWNTNITTNMSGMWQVSKYVCKHMRNAKQKGSVINISSITGLNRGELPGGVGYTASKAGVNAATKVMAVELGVHNIRVNAIAPGLFRSEITEALMHKEWLGKIAMRTVPLRTFVTVNPALTSLVQYLIHDSSEYVTGNVFIVDAGATLPGVPLFSSL